MALDNFVVTEAGGALLSAAALGGDVVFTRGALGRGTLGAEESLAARTALVDAVADMSVREAEVAEGLVRVRCCFTNADGQGGYLPAFRWNEAGLFARLGAEGEEVLLAYANTRDASAGDVIPATACEFEIEFALSLAGAETASFGSAGLIYATLGDLEGRAPALHAHPAGEVTSGTLAGRVSANAAAEAELTAAQVRNIIIATAAPAEGISDGDVWLSYS